MREMVRDRKRTRIIWATAAVLTLIVFIGCKPHSDIFTIGVVGHKINGLEFDSFRTGMTELGYIEGGNYKMVYKDIPSLTNYRGIDAKLKEILAEDMDMLLIKEMEVALRAKGLVKGTDMPVLLIGCPSPVESGIVDSISRPGGNITGVQVVDSGPKALEWLARITPDAKKIWLPCNPDDLISALELAKLDKALPQLGIELAIQKINSVEETIDAINQLPEEIDAVFFIPSPILNDEAGRLNRAAIKKNITTGASLGLDEDILITFKTDMSDCGRKTARIAGQIIQGVEPADLPIETSEAQLIINLKTAEAIGLNIPDAVLEQATIIIR